MWALDLGTTNTGLARWDSVTNKPVMVDFPDLCRAPEATEELEAPRMIPSAVHVLDDTGFWGKVGKWGFVAKRTFVGKQALIGRAALELNEGELQPNFCKSFKHALGVGPLQTVARVGRETFTARDVARLFVRELLAHVKSTTKERVRDLVMTAPVDAYESYRAELKSIAEGLGVERLRLLDEPVAAAIGYGLSVIEKRRVLVVDFGGGTLDLALVDLGVKGLQEGTCQVRAKAGAAIGGDTVDAWLLEEFCKRLEYPLARDRELESGFWYRLMLEDARRVKEALFFRDQATFDVAPPDDLRRFEARLRGESKAEALDVSRDDVVEILEGKGLYRALDGCLETVLEQARVAGIEPEDIGDVLMVGGSTLLPSVYPRIEARFGRDRVRAWQPFEAVTYGACTFASGNVSQSDFIIHDYALATFDSEGREHFEVVVKRGTRFPTPPDVWKRQLVPTCSLGQPEKLFKLVISEIGSPDERAFVWDSSGDVHKVGGKSGETRTVVKLNGANPTLGHLLPPHQPDDRRPRLEVSFGVNADRWLVATVLDLYTKKLLMSGEAVVRLL